MASVQFANLSVRFGEKELLDYKEIVVSAFLKDTYVRKYGRSFYHFFETKIGYADPSDPLSLAIWGRLVKETTLERDQYYSDGEIIKSHATLKSAPTSFFIFFIADHRLAFIPETRFAPTLGNFETTIKRFIANEYSDWSRQLYDSNKKIDPSYTWGKLAVEHPLPIVALVPLTARENIQDFISRFSIIESLTVHLIQRNQDISGGVLFDAMVKTSEKIGGNSARLIVNGKKDVGLNNQETAEFVSETTSRGYERVVLTGKDERGDTLKGSNDDFKLITHVDVAGDTEQEVVSEVYKAYNANKEAGIIKVSPRDPTSVGNTLRQIIDGK